MSVSINFLSFGRPIPSNFADPLDNSNAPNVGPLNLGSVNNFNWVFTGLGWDSPFASPIEFGSAFNFGQILSGGGGTGMTSNLAQFGANPPYMIPTAIIPVRLLPAFGDLRLNSLFYKAKQKFVQFTFNAIGVNNAAGVGLINLEDGSGVGVGGASNICHDGYVCRCDGLIVRYRSGAISTAVIAMLTFAQGDVYRMSLDTTSGTSTVVTVTKNGTVINTFTDNTLILNNAFPIITLIASSVATWQFEIKNFSCGVGL